MTECIEVWQAKDYIAATFVIVSTLILIPMGPYVWMVLFQEFKDKDR